MPKISIIIPCYNVEKYLDRCMESILSQTLSDIEIICINDGSTDNSLVFLNKYASSDNRFTIINKKNEGVGIARNAGLKLAQGEYIYFVDPDDWLQNSGVLLKIFEKAKSENLDMLIFGGYSIHTVLFSVPRKPNFICSLRWRIWFWLTGVVWRSDPGALRGLLTVL